MKVRYSPRSIRDLQRIHAYINRESGDREVANRFVSAIFDECRFMAVLPERYPAYPYARHWRMLPFGNYLIFFQLAARKSVSATSAMPRVGPSAVEKWDIAG